MKFLKNNIKLIIGIVIGAVLTGGIVYAAVSATGVSYTREGTDITNVAQALNDLYGKQPFIWKNEEHSALEAQTIQCDMSKYKHAIIFFEYCNNYVYTGVTEVYTYDITIGETKTLSAGNNNDSYTATRDITFNSNGIAITTGYYDGGTTGTGNQYEIIDGIILY